MPRKKTNKKLSELVFTPEVKELATGITSEKLSAMFFDIATLKRQPEPMYRLDTGSYRYYYRYENGEPVFYVSVTTLIKNTLPTSPHLIKWMVNQGDAGKDIAEEKADYGTFLHACTGELIMTGKFDLDKLPGLLREFTVREKIDYKEAWLDDLKRDILAFAQFIIDRNVKPLAVELILWHPIDGYAGAIDDVVEMDEEEKGFFGEVYKSGENKGKPKESKRTIRIRAIIDVKSGRKGFYESHEVQLKAYKNMWDVHFPELPIDRVYNWSPKDWKNTPSYNLKDQTGSANAEKLPMLVKIAKLEDAKRSNIVTVCKGNIDLTKGLTENITEKTFAELVKTR